MTRNDWAAAGLAALIGGPLVFAFSAAVADGATRARVAPLMAVFGSRPYEGMCRGEATPVHYLGNERRAPEFELQDRHGKPWKLSDHRGKVVVMNFWTVTCAPCLEEMPSLEALARSYAGSRDVEVVSISTDANYAEVEETFAVMRSQSFPELTALKVLFDPEKQVVGGKFGTRMFPETWIIDPEGVVRFRYDGAFNWASPLASDVIQSFRRGSSSCPGVS